MAYPPTSHIAKINSNNLLIFEKMQAILNYGSNVSKLSIPLCDTLMVFLLGNINIDLLCILILLRSSASIIM